MQANRRTRRAVRVPYLWRRTGSGSSRPELGRTSSLCPGKAGTRALPKVSVDLLTLGRGPPSDLQADLFFEIDTGVRMDAVNR